MEQADNESIIREQNLVREVVGLNDDVNITFNDFGWTSRVYIINRGEIVFKFPRYEKVKQEYLAEIEAYKIASNLGGVRVPNVCWEHPNLDYMGYKGIIGDPLDKVISTFSTVQMASIGTALGSFLKKFHQCNMSKAFVMSFDEEIAENKNKLELGLEAMGKYLSEREILKVNQLILEEYPERILNLGFEKGLCHGDLGYWNMICCSDGQIGIIDFGDVGYYDISKDFAGMNDSTMLAAALQAYGSNTLRKKIELRMRVIPILDLPFFIGKQDESGVITTIERIKNALK